MPTENKIDCPAFHERSSGYPYGDRVPRTVRMLVTATADRIPGIELSHYPEAKAGQTYPVWTNSHGAVTAVMEDGTRLGLRPAEFEVESWHYLAAEPAPQHQAEADSYPPCDYCGITPDYHPWHGSGMINGVENRYIHACDGCRGELPRHPGQEHAEPIAWMVGTAIWWTKEEAERDAAATGLPIVGLGPMTDTGEVERLSAACAANIRARDEAIAEGRRYMGQASALDAVLREARRCVAESAAPETGGPTQREAQVVLGKIDATLSASAEQSAQATTEVEK